MSRPRASNTKPVKPTSSSGTHLFGDATISYKFCIRFMREVLATLNDPDKNKVEEALVAMMDDANWASYRSLWYKEMVQKQQTLEQKTEQTAVETESKPKKSSSLSATIRKGYEKLTEKRDQQPSEPKQQPSAADHEKEMEMVKTRLDKLQDDFGKATKSFIEILVKNGADPALVNSSLKKVFHQPWQNAFEFVRQIKLPENKLLPPQDVKRIIL